MDEADRLLDMDFEKPIEKVKRFESIYFICPLTAGVGLCIDFASDSPRSSHILVLCNDDYARRKTAGSVQTARSQ
jgi:hypothetical protein